MYNDICDASTYSEHSSNPLKSSKLRCDYVEEFNNQDDYREMNGYGGKRIDGNQRDVGSHNFDDLDGDDLSSELNGLCTSDQAFEMTANLIVGYLLPKITKKSSRYYLTSSDIIFLDAVVPLSIRADFVEAVAFRSSSIVSGKHSDLKKLVKECEMLGLGEQDSFLLGGGIKMDDGRILVKVRQLEYSYSFF